jgi:putative ABC transport system substrate-binding protein
MYFRQWKRREFITVLGGAAAWPLTARAQQREGVRRIGVLMSTAESDAVSQAWLATLRRDLEELGRPEGRAVSFEVRWGGGAMDRIRSHAAELAKLAPDVILASGSPSAAALKQATTSIPVVFVIVNDPVAQGIVPSIARPGGNITGFSLVDYSVLGKAMELLSQVAGASRIGVMFNPDTYPYYETYLKSFRSDQPTFKLEVTGVRVRAASEIEPEIGKLAGSGTALIVAPDSFNNVHRMPIIKAAAQHRIPASYPYRQYVQDGGLMAYGPDPADLFKRAAAYLDRILKGAKPGELPVQAPTKFEFTINMKTATALGLTLSPTVLALTDEVIE